MASSAPKKHEAGTLQSAAETPDKGMTGLAASVADEWDSEKKLVSALSQLQDLDSKIQQLRSLVPTRIWAPVTPLIAAKYGDSPDEVVVPSPRELYEQFVVTTRDAVKEVEDFTTAWRNPDVQATFNHVNAKLQSGNYTQTIGRWERDYDVILRKLDAQEQRKKQEYSKNLENQKRSLAAIRESWKDIARSFSLNEKSGLTIKPLPSTKDMARFTVILRNISAVFSVQQINDLDNERIEQWHVTLEPRPNAGRLEVEISNAIQSRGRKWDLAYLLTLISSYSDIKTAPCVGCKNLLDRSAQLPVLRKPKRTDPSDVDSALTWEPYHPLCV